MLHTNKSSGIRSALATVAIGVVLSLVVLNAERHQSVFVEDAVSAPVATSAAATSASFDYFPSHFAAPAGAIEALPPQF